MTEEKQVYHINVLVKNFNAIYKDYKHEENPNTKVVLRKMLMHNALWIAKDFNELEKILGEVVQNDNRRKDCVCNRKGNAQV